MKLLYKSVVFKFCFHIFIHCWSLYTTLHSSGGCFFFFFLQSEHSIPVETTQISFPFPHSFLYFESTLLKSAIKVYPLSFLVLLTNGSSPQYKLFPVHYTVSKTSGVAFVINKQTDPCSSDSMWAHFSNLWLTNTFIQFLVKISSPTVNRSVH